MKGEKKRHWSRSSNKPHSRSRELFELLSSLYGQPCYSSQMEDISMKNSVKDWKVKLVKNFILFLIIFPILLLLRRAVLNRPENKEIPPPDNCSVRKLEMRNDNLSHSPSSYLSLHLPMKGTKSSFSVSVPFPLGFCMYLGTYANFRDTFTYTVLFLSSELILPCLSRYANPLL